MFQIKKINPFFKKNFNSSKLTNFLDLCDTPKVENFNNLNKDNFEDFVDEASLLNKEGFCKLNINDPDWFVDIDNVKDTLKNQISQNYNLKNDLGNCRFQDAGLKLGIKSVNKIASHPFIINFLRIIYGREPFPFQTLNFIKGSQQHFHSDAIHFHSLPYGFMCGVWVALEDVHPDSGPLMYFPKSHKLPYISAKSLGLTNKEVFSEINPQILFEDYWKKKVKFHDFQKNIFLAKKGDVFIWHANLLHGGTKVINENLTRWSQVTHYFFKDCFYTTPMFQTSDMGKEGPHIRKVNNLLIDTK